MQKFNCFLRYLFFLGLIRPLVWLLIGLNIKTPQHLPHQGPAIIVANHNSHLDTLVLMALLPIKLLKHVKPVAAADYFMTNPIKAWFAKEIIGILPINRRGNGADPIRACEGALKAGNILIFFPEGSRGNPEIMDNFKYGVCKLAARVPEVKLYPVYMRGLGKALPKGEALLVPFVCDVAFAEPIVHRGNDRKLHTQLSALFSQLQEKFRGPAWD